ncbi:PAS domain-containing sensor histidine kinase [Clostridium sp. 'White wine YQ']|uniref:PAS domain-containing sensor histidine kinase n=1 Tax=Clostridium sp. 'White wine YQ' TaxID=3027474 RepID=UPI00236676D1|nr:PAS domain-containing sensor histidine kinase [Clostridium sp. 'White wine YQ']MDD7794417.1 ATP-binding protein [Clostridium sp. 'White wine YQ']
MHANNSFNSLKEVPYILVKNQIVTKVSNEFTNITEYTFEELLNKNISDVLITLKVGPDININNINDKVEYFLFSKSLEVRFVNIKVIDVKDERIYIFLKRTNFDAKRKFPFINTLCSDNFYGVGIFSVPDGTLIKANSRYISIFDAPYNIKENCVGKNVYEFLTGFKGSSLEEVWRNVLETGKSNNYEEIMYDGLNRGTTYWKLYLIPIIENSEIKYCVVMSLDITEQVLSRKKIQEQAKIIKKQKEQLEEIIQGIDDAIFIYDSDKMPYLVNNSAKSYFPGYEVNDFGIAYMKYKYYDIDGKEISIKETIVSEILNNKVILNEMITMKSNEITRHLSINGRPIYNINGDIILVVIYSRDITKDVEAKRIIEQQNKRLEAIIESVGDILTLIDVDGNLIKQSKLITNRFTDLKKAKEAYEQADYFDFEGNKLRSEDICVSRVLKGEKVKNQKIKVIKDSSELYTITNGIPVFNSKGNVELGVFTTIDITELMEQEKKIKLQKELLEDIMENMHEMMIVFNKEGNVLFSDKKTRSRNINIFEKVRNFFNLTTLYSMDGKVITFEESPLVRVMRGEKVKDEIAYYNCCGKTNYTTYGAKGVYDENGDFLYGIFYRRDMTEFVENQNKLRVMQEKLLVSEMEKNESLTKALEMKDEFLSLVSHEFRTPLNVISTAIQAMNLICGEELSEKSKEYLGMIRQNTFRQLRLVNNLLDITRVNAGHIKINKKNIDIVFLSKAITESVCEYAFQKGVKVTFITSFKKKVVAIDDEKYERIILNLLSNSIKFTCKGQSIIVSIGYHKGSVCIEVKDNGIGIPEDKVETIFERFGQVDSSLSRQAEGTGIGLSLVKKFVEALGGSISVKSKVGEGSTFTVLIPDEIVSEEDKEKQLEDLLDNRLVQSTHVEFSDIYI